jgi:hypothetical protein
MALMVLAALGVTGCAGYNLQVGTGGFGEFTQVYSIPATTLTPWGARGSQPALPPPSDGGAGSSTLPAARSDLPPDRSPASSSN